MLGFGRSDKPVDRRAHSIERCIHWLRELVVGLGLCGVTLVCQDWGSTMGCGVVALEPDRFARILVAKGIFHTAEPAESQVSLSGASLAALLAQPDVRGRRTANSESERSTCDRSGSLRD